MSQMQKIDENLASVRWDLTDLYQDLDDPALEADLQHLLRAMQAFHDSFQGKLDTTLGDALDADAEIGTNYNYISPILFPNSRIS